MEINILTQDGIKIIKLRGELDISSVGNFKSTVLRAKIDVPRLRIDFIDLDFIDSTGVGTLVEILRELKEEDYKIEVCNISHDIFEILDLLGITEMFGTDYLKLVN